MNPTDFLSRPLIGGHWLDDQGRHSEAVIGAATGAPVGRVVHASSEDLDRAAALAAEHFPAWRARLPGERAAVLRRAAGLLRERADEVAHRVARELGKPLAQGHWEVQNAAETLEWFAEEGRRAYGRVLPARAGLPRFTVTQEPVGPVLSLAPWNFPVVNAARKIGAALAAGCTCVHKPAEEAPGSALAVAEALVDAGLPAGVLGIVFGVPAEVSSRLLASPAFRKLSFTGSVPVGKALMKLAAERCLRTTMELGGHAPVIVCDDVDLDRVLDLAVEAKYRNAGQVCVSPTRFFVASALYPDFAAGFARRANDIVVGNGLDPAVRMGPLAHERRREAVAALVEDAQRQGAQLLAGGRRLPGPGWFYAPTVLGKVPSSAAIMNEEPFGPVALLQPFDDLGRVLAEANRLPYGLAAFGFSRSADRLRQIADGLEAGMVGLNSFAISLPETPFGGVKDSGHGAENGIEGLQACLVTKVISQC